jgi:predicted dehydrogenase
MGSGNEQATRFAGDGATVTKMQADFLNRREFLATAGLTAAAVGLGSAPALDGETPGPKRRIRIGFLGATHSHAPGKLDVIQASPEFELVGACEESPPAKQSFEKQGAKIIPQEELLAHSEVVAVESAVRDHARHALLALKAGKHVHLEKPPATTLLELQEMITLAREKNVLLQTGYMWRYHPGFQKIFEAVRQGWLGDIFMVRAAISNKLALARRPEWGEFKGGALFELGSHLLDAIVRLLGRPNKVTPFLRRHGKAADDFKDNNVAVFEYDHALAVLTNTALQEAKLGQRSFEVLGSNGTAMLRPIEPPILEIELVNAAGPYNKGKQPVTLPTYRRYEADFAALAAAVRGNRPLPVTSEQELAVQETLLKASEMP